ncbi:hypothetical protein SACS_1815 [Parasaccharibacter apium]|uniref:Uncharacterized protein n=1 Tax=Parasaccharibacter apium TaxID=1510841 RepID=A0A7U7J003_9PROT|nr:hypothetical protein SACS_1815 [Parasaccharibacter apium]
MLSNPLPNPYSRLSMPIGQDMTRPDLSARDWKTEMDSLSSQRRRNSPRA